MDAKSMLCLSALDKGLQFGHRFAGDIHNLLPLRAVAEMIQEMLAGSCRLVVLLGHDVTNCQMLIPSTIQKATVKIAMVASRITQL